MSSAPANVRVVVRLPFNRPEQPVHDPPRVEWNDEKANILWEVIARSRASNSGGADWKGLAAHLEVPLPYLLYRAQTRYEEDLRGLQEVRGTLTPSKEHAAKGNDEFPFIAERPTAIRRLSGRMTGSTPRLASSTRLTTPTLGVRTRLNSLGQTTPSRPKKASSSSTLTLQGPNRGYTPLRPTSPSSSEGTDSEDEAAAKEEEEDRSLEEQEALDRQLEELKKMMTNDALGLVRSARPRGKGKEADRGRMGLSSPSPMKRTSTFRDDELSSRSHSVSSTSSPQGSIPSIPSPPPDQPQSPISRHLSPGKSTSPPAISPRSALGQSHLAYRPVMGRTSASEQGSTHGSSASSFSDISDTSLSASALESALMSNIRGGGSRFSAFARSRLTGRGGGVPH